MNCVLGLLFVDGDEHLGFMNAGNFHGQYVAVACPEGSCYSRVRRANIGWCCHCETALWFQELIKYSH